MKNFDVIFKNGKTVTENGLEDCDIAVTDGKIFEIGEINADAKVVEDVSDLWTFEKIGFYRGLYHVLGGSLSAIQGIGTDDLKLQNLVNRINNKKPKEIILALSTTMEGQTTSFVIADKLEKFDGLNVTRLAQGIPMGGEVHYLDENTLSTAFQSRKKIT